MSDKVKIVDGVPVPYSFTQLREDNPLVQFPADPSGDLLAEYDVYTLTMEAEPSYDKKTQRLEKGDIDSFGNGFIQRYRVVQLSTEEQADRLLELRAEMAVPRLAARLALIDAGLWDSIQPLLTAITDATAKARAQAYFEDAQNWRRLDPTVVMLGAGLGLSEAEIDDLFTAAQAYA